MTFKLSTGVRNAQAGTLGLAGALNGGCILVYSGPQPITADASPTGVLLGRATLNGDPWVAGSPTNGLVLDAPANGGVLKPASAIWKFIGLAAGTIGWFRFVGNAADDGSLSVVLPRLDGAAAVGSGEGKFSTLTVTVGQPITIDSFSYMIPAQ